jgi:hypothetical protein
LIYPLITHQYKSVLPPSANDDWHTRIQISTTDGWDGLS